MSEYSFMESVFSGPGSRRGEDNYSMMDSVGKKVPLAPTGSLNKGSIQSNNHSNHAAAPMAPAQAEEHPGLAPGSSANTSVANALKGVEFIAQHIKDEDRDNEVGKTKNHEGIVKNCQIVCSVRLLQFPP